jgi:hypothetical protein
MGKYEQNHLETPKSVKHFPDFSTHMVVGVLVKPLWSKHEQTENYEQIMRVGWKS